MKTKNTLFGFAPAVLTFMLFPFTCTKGDPDPIDPQKEIIDVALTKVCYEPHATIANAYIVHYTVKNVGNVSLDRSKVFVQSETNTFNQTNRGFGGGTLEIYGPGQFKPNETYEFSLQIGYPFAFDTVKSYVEVIAPLVDVNSTNDRQIAPLCQ